MKPRTLQFLSPIHKATRQLGAWLEGPMAQLGLSNPEAHLIAYLRSYGPCAVGDLHRVFGHRRSTLTSMLDRLQRKGLVSRATHPRDRRSVLVALTDRGRKKGERIRRELQALEERIRRRLDAEDLEAFVRVVRAIEEATGPRGGES